MSADAHSREIRNHTPTDQLVVYCICGWTFSMSYYDKSVQQAGEACVAAHNAHRAEHGL